MSLNDFIDKSNQFTRARDEMPVVDRSQHVSLGVEMAARAAAQLPPPEPARMPPIMPVAN